MCWRPNATIQIAPHERSKHAEPFTLFRFPQQGLTDLVFLDQHIRAKPADIERHWHAFNTLVTEAAPPEQTPHIIKAVLTTGLTR